MACTPYSITKAEFSNRAHQLAQTELYPKIFRVPSQNLSFDNDTLLNSGKKGEVLDGQMAVDRIVRVTALSTRLRSPLTFTVQERFRMPGFRSYRDITFTEWNNESNLPSELYKLVANIFLYGYYDEDFDKEKEVHRRPPIFKEAIAVDVPLTLIGICNDSLIYNFGFNKDKNQPFVTIKFDDLWRYGSVLYWTNPPSPLQDCFL